MSPPKLNANFAFCKEPQKLKQGELRRPTVLPSLTYQLCEVKLPRRQLQGKLGGCIFKVEKAPYRSLALKSLGCEEELFTSVDVFQLF